MNTSRIDLVDGLRGFALMGLFLVHSVELFELYWAHPKPNPVFDWVFILFASKSFALFALCFGLSFFILMDRAAQRGVDFSGRFAWRLSLLLLLGFAHSLLYRGDILEVLGLMGLPLILFNRIRSNRILTAVAAVFLLQPLLILRTIAALSGAAWANHPPAFEADNGLGALPNASFPQALALNLVGGHVSKWSYYFDTGRISEIVGLYLLGLVLGRTGFFVAPDRFKTQRRIWLVVGAGVYAALLLGRVQLLALLPAKAEGARSSVGMMLDGWTALALLSVQVVLFIDLWRTAAGRLLQPLAAVGRMTLTFYIGQSLVFVPLYYGFGLGLHASLSSAQALTIGLVAYAVQIVIANLWMSKFAYGPLEWAWRSATYLSGDIPLLRRPPTPAEPVAAA